MWVRYVVVLICFAIDGLIASLAPVNFMNNGMYFIPCLGFCAMVLSFRKMGTLDAVLMALVMGMVYDFFFTYSFLTYSIIFVLICFVVKFWTRHLGFTMLENLTICEATIFVKEFIIILLLIIFNRTTINLGTWLANRMFLTIVINAVLISALQFIVNVSEGLINTRDTKIRKEERLDWTSTYRH